MPKEQNLDAALKVVQENPYTGTAEQVVTLSLAIAEAGNALDASTESVEVQVSAKMGQLEISVVDRGTGMTEDVLRRADDPFFTTKEAGKGMGLGRFIARDIFQY